MSSLAAHYGLGGTAAVLPQCASCSQVQAAAVKSPKSVGFGGRVVAHHTAVRLYHLTGGLLVALVCGVDRAVAEVGGARGAGLGGGGVASDRGLPGPEEGRAHGAVK